jgi:hypothetical protein
MRKPLRLARRLIRARNGRADFPAGAAIPSTLGTVLMDPSGPPWDEGNLKGRSTAALIALLLLLLPLPLRADGGTLRVANVPMGAYRINVFTDPTPIPPDSVDVSILATFERGRGIARGLDVVVTALRTDGTGSPMTHPATREQADDPRYYAAKFALGSEGEWEIRVRVQGPEGEGEVVFQVTAREPGLLANPFLILTLALLPLVLVGLWLKRSGGAAPPTPSTRPGGR